MKNKGFIIALVCTMLITAAAGIIVSGMLTKDGSKNLPSMMEGNNNSSSVSDTSSKTETGSSMSAQTSEVTESTESPQNSAATENSAGTDISAATENSDGTDISAGTESSESTDISAAENSESAENLENAESNTANPEEAESTEASEASGLSTATTPYDPELLLADGSRAYDYTTPPEGSPIDYVDFSTDDFVNTVAAVYQWAHDNHFQYGNSGTLPPCEDGFISCDRLISRSLWDLGITDQPQGGVQVYMDGMDEEYWFTHHGFIKINDPSLLQRGDIVFQRLYDEAGNPTNDWHNFVLVAYDPETQMCEKYDCGHFTPEGNDRISSEQPFHVPLADFGDARRFVCGFRLRERPAEQTEQAEQAE